MGKMPPEAKAVGDRYLVPGLIRGLEVLQAFAPERPRLTLGDIAAAAGVTRSAVFRIAYTLTQLGFLVNDPRSSSYVLGPAVLRLGYGYLASRELVEVALPHLGALRDLTGLSAHLGILEGTEVVYLLRLPTRRGLASIVHVGSRLPAHATSMGRILLAALSETELRTRYANTRLVGVGPRTPTTLAALFAQAHRDKTRGYIHHLGEFEPGVTSVAAPVRDVSGSVVAAINAAGGIAQRNGSGAEQLVRQVLDSAAAISAGLGFAALPPAGRTASSPQAR